MVRFGLPAMKAPHLQQVIGEVDASVAALTHREPVVHHDAASVPGVGVPGPPAQVLHAAVPAVYCCALVAHVRAHVRHERNICVLHVTWRPVTIALRSLPPCLPKTDPALLCV